MRNPTCLTCKNTGMVNLPTEEIIRSREVFDAGDWIIETTVFKRGGVDACPVCAARAEAEYVGLPIFREEAA